MATRLIIAFVGASAITLGMLLGMSEIAEIFEQQNPARYFSITDVLLQPEGARPERPPRAAEQPDTGPVEFDRPDVYLDVDEPAVELEGATDSPAIRPRLDEQPPRD